MPADTPTPGDSGAPLNLDDRVPCASCGGEFVWCVMTDEDEVVNMVGWCSSCPSAWDGAPAPVTWRTLATVADEVPAAYVARLVAEVDRLTAERDEARSQEEYQRLVNALLCTPTEVAPLSNQDINDPRVAVRSSLMTMAIKLMAAAVRANPHAINYGAWKVAANPDALVHAEPGSPEDIDGWDIHVACVRPGGKGPADLVADVKQERDELAARVDQLSDRVTAAEGRLELAAMAGGGAR